MSIIRLQNGNGETGVYYEFDSSQKPLGEGGMGRVFRGVQIVEGDNGSKKDREVAIKCLLEDLPEHAIKRSQREASIRLKNDNLVEMIDFVETHDSYVTHYHVVSELLKGVNLDELLEGRTTNHDGRPNPTADRLYRYYRENRKAFVGEVFRNILSGIMALHDAGYIHRDIDPSNIMVTSEGNVKLIDFGIAKKVNDLYSSEKSLTSPGQFIGKPFYAAPELLLGDLKQQNYTTDVYALGIMLFQLMTGHLPFEGTHQEVYEKQMHEKLPLSQIEDKTVRKIIEKATEKDQKKRYQSAAEFRVDLDRWIAETPVPPKPIGKWIGIAAAGLVIVGLVVFFATRPPKPPKPPMPDTLAVDTPKVEKKNRSNDSTTVTIEEVERLLMQQSTANEGLAMLDQLIDMGSYEALFLKSRIYYDPKAVKDNNGNELKKGNEFYDPKWETMRKDCGLEADNGRAHTYLLDAFHRNESDIAVLYELGFDFLYGSYGRGTGKKDWGRASWCFRSIDSLAKAGDPHKNNELKEILIATKDYTPVKP